MSSPLLSSPDNYETAIKSTIRSTCDEENNDDATTTTTTTAITNWEASVSLAKAIMGAGRYVQYVAINIDACTDLMRRTDWYDETTDRSF
jgi:hypothetical protein